MTLFSKLYKKIEEVKKVYQEMGDSESHLVNNNIVMEELGHIFTIMQTYHYRITALAEDVNLQLRSLVLPNFN